MDEYAEIHTVTAAQAEGREYSSFERAQICLGLLDCVSDRDKVVRFHTGVHAPSDARQLYPLFYILPYNVGKKNRLPTGELPATHLLSSNAYELETLRLLNIWDGNNDKVKMMTDTTVNRLSTTCFAHFCALGECVGSGVAALRFYSVLPGQCPSAQKLIGELGKLLLESPEKTPKELPFWCFFLTLSELDDEHSLSVIEQSQERLCGLLSKDWLVGPAVSDTYNIMRKYVLRNALSRLTHFAYLKNRKVTVSGDRCHMDIGAEYETVQFQ